MLDSLQNLGLLGLFIGSFLAATVLPFSTDALYIAILAITKDPWGCLIVGTVGNSLGSVLTYWIGWLGKWEWIEKWFHTSRDVLEKYKRYVDKYGVWLSLVVWVPFIGDAICIVLGFFRTRPVPTMILIFIGKAARFAVWNLLMHLF